MDRRIHGQTHRETDLYNRPAISLDSDIPCAAPDGKWPDCIDGEDLRLACSSAEHFSDCVFFLKTVHQTAKAIDHFSDGEPQGSIGSCAPEQGIDTVPLVIALKLAWQEYAERSPERMRNPVAEEVLLAYEERWPCQR
ncbi:MAG: hypothetical protein JSU95_04605 [Betaproteobacteria bacterium]|nr:MAG: hypothetical protein JSU95_04605 [Betaproteobacteria bacterium]